MAGYYNTYKVFTPGEILTAADLNASEQQHVTFQQAVVTEGYSRTLEQSRVQTASVSLAMTVADEIARLREKIRLLGGTQYWDQVLGPPKPEAQVMPKAQILFLWRVHPYQIILTRLRVWSETRHRRLPNEYRCRRRPLLRQRL